MNQSHGLSYDETLSYQKVLKVKIVCSYSKEEEDIYLLEDSPLT